MRTGGFGPLLGSWAGWESSLTHVRSMCAPASPPPSTPCPACGTCWRFLWPVPRSSGRQWAGYPGKCLHQGSTKLLSLLSEIIETPKFGRNFVLETMRKKFKQVYNSWQSCFCDRNLFLSKKQVSVTETSFCHRNRSGTSLCYKHKFLSKKQFSIIKTSFSQTGKFLSKKK